MHPFIALRAHRFRLRPLYAAVFLTCAGVSGVYAQSSPGAAQAPRAYAIAPGALAEVLNRFAAEAGVVLAFDGARLQGQQSPGLQGNYSVSQGFARLLAGSRFQIVETAPGSFALRERPPVRASGGSEPQAAEISLPSVQVSAPRIVTVDQLDREMIRSLPAINGDLTSQLKLNPNIQYDETQLSSTTGGEIAPAQISIHGSKPYQNELLLDGVSIANDLDPGSKVATNNPSLIPGSAQSLAIDSSIVCDVEVRDANVSAEYGRFTGGVVDATVCSARKRFGGSVSVGYTSSDWSTLIVDDARREAFENSTAADNQPRFRKWTYKSTLETRPHDDFGVLVSVIRQRSEIPLRRFTTSNEGSSESQEVTQTREQDTFLLKSDWAPAGSAHKTEATLVYAPTENTYFIENARNSDYTLKSGGLNLSGKLTSAFEPATLTQQLSYSQIDQSRRSDADYYRSWRWSTDKDWGDPSLSNASSLEGSWGNLDQTLQTFNYKSKAEFERFKLGATRHRVSAGVDLRSQHAEYARLSETYQYLTVANLPTTGAIASCQRADGSVDTEACSATPSINRSVGQYFTRLQHYRTGSFDMDARSYASYLEDEASWQDFKLRLGARLDRDSLTEDTNLAPRASFNWQVSDAFSLNLGANRYYGRNLFAYALQEKVNSLLYTQTRSGTLTWGTATQGKPANRLADIATPYDDELTAGMGYETGWGPVSFRFTRRKGQDQVVKRTVTGQTECANNSCYVYTNEGQSLSKDFTLSWSSAKALQSGPLATRAWVAFNKSDVKSNFASYDSSYSNAQADDEIIQYDGRFMRYSERPADNYNRPWTLRIGAMSHMPGWHLTLTNLLRIRDGYRQILRNGSTDYNGSSVAVWEKTALPRSIALDTVLLWSPPVYDGQNLDVKLTIENLTNRKNKISQNDTYATYERGRSFALEVGYRF